MRDTHRIWKWFSMILILALGLAGCGPAAAPTAGPAATPSASPASPTSAPTETTAAPTPTTAQPPAMLEFTNADYGYSLYYPEGYVIVQDFSHAVIILAPEGTEGHRERAFVNVELALDQSMDWYVQQALDGNSGLGITITTRQAIVAGQPVTIVEPLPGQDLSRQVFTVYKGILYHLTFIPDDAQAGEAYQQMEKLFAAVMTSLRFLPERREVPPVTSIPNMLNQIERALEARSSEDTLRTLGDDFFVGTWSADGVTTASYGRNEAVPFIFDTFIAQNPDLVMDSYPDWNTLVGSWDLFDAYFPGEVIRVGLAQGWGPQGSDEAAIILGRRGDNSLYWRGVIIAAGGFGQ